MLGIKKAKKIKLLVCDVDGVLTDGGLYFDAQGRELKRFNVQDGLGLKLLMQSGIEVAVISARATPSVTHRMKNLGIKHYYGGQNDKKHTLQKLVKKLNITLEQVAYIGDDVIDLPVMLIVGLAIAVSNANQALLPHADYKTKAKGGNGAVREVCDMLLKTMGVYDNMLKNILKNEMQIKNNNISSFYELCYNNLLKIPRGKVITYKDLAKLVGNKKAARAVGNAMNKNKFAPRVPCHRVVKSDGSIGGYASGSKKKIAILKKEGIKIVNNKVVDKKQFYKV